MNVYFDKDNLRSFVKSASRSAFQDCSRMLKNQLDIKFTFPKKDLAQENEIKEWIKTMNTGVNGNINWEVSPPKRPLTADSICEFNKSQLSSVYLLDDNFEDEIASNGLVVYGGVGSEVDILYSLIMKDTDYSFMKQIPICNLKNWKDLEKYLSPCTDIIIHHKYIFSSEDVNKPNIYSLIETLCTKAKNAIINIFVFTLPQIIIKTEDKTIKTSPNWEDIRKNIKRIVSNVTGKEPNVTFVLSSKLEHDRQIFTNYKYIKSGDTLNYFDSSWNIITDGSQIELFSLANKEFYKNGFDFVARENEVYNKVCEKNSSNVIGEEICNYFKKK